MLKKVIYINVNLSNTNLDSYTLYRRNLLSFFVLMIYRENSGNRIWSSRNTFYVVEMQPLEKTVPRALHGKHQKNDTALLDSYML